MITNNLSETDSNEECMHDNTVESNGFLTCDNCGQVIDELVFSKHSVRINDLNFSEVTSRFGFGRTEIYRKKSSLKPRLTQLNKKLLLDKSNQNRIKLILLNTCNKSGIPVYIREDTLYRYLKLRKKTRISNNITCIAFCLWYSVKKHNLPLSLNEIIEIFQGEGHTVNTHLIMKAMKKYSSILRKLNFNPIPIKTPKDYIPKLIDKLRENIEVIQEKMKYKNVNCYKNLETFLLELEQLSLDIIKKLSFQVRTQGINPLNFAGAFIYFANLLLALKHDYKNFLTQSMLSQFTGISSYSIRDLYVTNLKKYIQN